MTNQHIEEEMLAGLLLYSLEPDEAAAVQSHVETCSDCRARLDEVRILLGLVAESPEVLEPPSSLKAGILAAASAVPAPIRPATTPTPVAPIARAPAFSLRFGLALAAALVVGAVLGGLVWSAIQPSNQDGDLDGLIQAIAGTTDNLVLPMNGTADAPRVRAALIASSTEDRIYVVASNVPQLPPGQAYHLYLYSGGVPKQVASLKPDDNGRISAALDLSLAEFDGMELDLQAQGSTTPGGTAVLKSDLP